MRLRAILILLATLAFLSASIGVYVHYTSLRSAFLRTSEKQVEQMAGRIQGQLSSYLSEQLKPARVLAWLPEIRAALVDGGRPALDAANEILDDFQRALGVDVCYLMNRDGDTVASSNRGDPDSFVGKNFSFRPYFQQAMRSVPATYMALGITSGRRGVYYSYPVHGDQRLTPVGVVVIKAPVGPIEERLRGAEGATAMLVDPNGIVFIANDPGWLFRSLGRLTEEQERAIRETKQFGEGPWPWAGLTLTQGGRAYARDGSPLLFHQVPLAQFPGWRVALLLPSRYEYLGYLRPFLGRNRPLVLPLLALICVSVVVLYRKASSEVTQRRIAETALAESEERFRTLYHNTPAMLHSIDASGRLVGVSDYWTEVMGYSRDEVIGRPITDFMVEESRRRAETVAIPRFLEVGFCKDVAYRLRKKNGEEIDVLLSATAERDAAGAITRSLAVLVDVTERKRVERRLHRAQEMLRSHSRELERQVRERTLEITNILKYTPSLVSLKDRQGRYLLVNSRFEELFEVDGAAIRGRTDREVFPARLAGRLSAHDREVVRAGRPFSVEETIPQKGKPRTYLSAKFPLFDEQGRVNGVGSIATDVTALKEAQERLRQLSGRILEGEERERAAIARELHDELGQILTALRMDAAWLRKRLLTADPGAAARAATMCDTIDGTIDEVRRVVMRLRPGVLDDLGLIPALEWVAGDFEKRTGIPCAFRHSGVPGITGAAATATYRICQETLTNVARHAGAGRVEVSLAARDGELVLTVRDDGRGFDHGAAAGGQGIAGIRERAALIGGAVELRSRPGAGTTVTFRLPLDGHSPEGAG